MKKFFILVVLAGCSQTESKKEIFVEISQNKFEEIAGHNAAVAQFGTSDMLINTENFRVNKYLNEKQNDNPESGYVIGYHRALELIHNSRKGCPDIH